MYKLFYSIRNTVVKLEQEFHKISSHNYAVFLITYSTFLRLLLILLYLLYLNLIHQVFPQIGFTKV
jgi:hypothetical protein